MLYGAPAHALREANRMGDFGVNGVERVGVKEVERVNDKGDNDDEVDDDEGEGDNDKVDIDKDESDGFESDDDGSGDDEAGDNGRGRIRRVLLVEEGAVFGRAIDGTVGKARGVVTFFIHEAPGNVLLSTLAAA